MDVLKKMLSGFLCVVILFLTGGHYPISKNAGKVVSLLNGQMFNPYGHM